MAPAYFISVSGDEIQSYIKVTEEKIDWRHHFE